MRIHYCPFLLLLLTACSNPASKKTEAENDLDAARQFIRSALDGRFDLARDYLLSDSLNNNYLDLAERSYQHLTPADKENYKGSTIVVHNASYPNDSVSILIYSNSFKNDRDTLRVVQVNGKWLVDLKYLFGHGRNAAASSTSINTDTLP